jgi:uncharacterized protein (TIGR02421 family)
MTASTEIEPPSCSNTTLAGSIRHFSQRLISTQRPIRLLSSLIWDEQVERDFLANHCRELPVITRASYLNRTLAFDPDSKQLEFQDLSRDVAHSLGRHCGVGAILVRMCREYAGIVRLLEYRGTKLFAELSARLFGRVCDHAASDLQLLAQMEQRFPAHHNQSPLRDAEDALGELATRLRSFFPNEKVRFKLADHLSAHAVAGNDCLRLQRGDCFTPDEIRLLEVHEGWVHIGTSLNAQAQPICTFLQKCPPTSTRTQEGLAVLTEFLTASAHPGRLRRLRLRVEGIRMAENGADFLQVFRHFHETFEDDRECYRHTARVFRGSLPAGCGPFTKDLSYVGGLAAAIDLFRSGRSDVAALLFSGKTALEDIDTLAELADLGYLKPPRFMPPPFQKPIEV